ncbi:hypothetical protein [Nocardia vulneris]|uniref:hypothetical protein n=1 Tax=Nocardia vulneris TaxID=1141657 RepID=UPI000A75862F|nr:hypothetical protein [Nocardia vulneris]
MGAPEYGVSTRTLTVLVYIVTVVWAVNIVAPLLFQAYESNTGANGIMGALLGLLGAARYQASRNKEPKKKADPSE